MLINGQNTITPLHSLAGERRQRYIYIDHSKIEIERERGLLPVGIVFGGREIACLAAALGLLA